MNTTTNNDSYLITKKKELFDTFEEVKLSIYKELATRFSKKNINHILFLAEQELNEMVPELPFYESETNPYKRLVIFAGIGAAIHLALIAVLKNKSEARNISFLFFKNFIGTQFIIPQHLYNAWVIFNALRYRLEQAKIISS